MNDVSNESPSARYAKCIEVSRRIRWDIDRDVIRGRQLDPVHKYLPDGLAQVDRLPFLIPAQRLLMSQVQGRTYANMFRLVERFVSAKMLEVSRNHALGDQTALEAVVRFTDEELKHQELFRRIELLAANSMLPGYRFMPKADEVASFVLGKSTWSVLALTCCIEIVTQVHYRESMELDSGLSPLFKDVFLFHWKEESQHAIIDELEWEREDAQLTDAGRNVAIDDLIELVNAVDGLLQMQAAADAGYFLVHAGGTMSVGERRAVSAALLDAYRWQYIVSGVTQPRFSKLLYRMITPAQAEHIGDALAPIMQRPSDIDALVSA